MQDIERLLGKSEEQAAAAVVAPVLKSGVKPKLRGWLDVMAVIAAVPAVSILIAYAQPGLATVGATVFGLALVFLFGVSATYHVPMWAPRYRAIWRRIDHSAIYVLIAGSYTPVCLLFLPDAVGTTLLWLVWLIALFGVFRAVFWVSAPRGLNTVSYIVQGWLIVPFLLDLYFAVGLFPLLMLAGGGLLYTIGAVIYVKRWPNPAPSVFGYHEVFHTFVVAAGALHVVGMWSMLT